MWGTRANAAIFDCADAKVAKAVKKLIKKNLPDTLIYKKINAKDPLAVTITRGKFEKGQNETVDKVVWEAGITDLPPNGKKQSFVKIYEDMTSPNDYSLLTNSERKGVNIENFNFTKF